jgi:hypothetical protein
MVQRHKIHCRIRFVADISTHWGVDLDIQKIEEVGGQISIDQKDGPFLPRNIPDIRGWNYASPGSTSGPGKFWSAPAGRIAKSSSNAIADWYLVSLPFLEQMHQWITRPLII